MRGQAAKDIDGIGKRLRDFEAHDEDKDDDENGGNHTSSGAMIAWWTPKHLICGGWQPKAPRSTIEQARELVARQDQHARDRCLQAYALKKFGESAKLRIEEGKLSMTGWAVARVPEKQTPGMGPTWSAIEGRPEEGRRIQAPTEAVEKAMKLLGAGFAAEQHGTIDKGGMLVMQYDTVRGQWSRRTGWAGLRLGGIGRMP